MWVGYCSSKSAKQERHVIRGIALKWFKNYLANRTQYVEYNNTTSSLRGVECGVPQGSILGPLLFLLYINDIPNVSDSLYFIMYADDTNIFLSHHCIDTLESNMNIQIEKLFKWMTVNRKSLNVEKTKAIIFSNNLIDKNISIKMAGKEVQFVDQIKFLGVIIDKKIAMALSY